MLTSLVHTNKVSFPFDVYYFKSDPLSDKDRDELKRIYENVCFKEIDEKDYEFVSARYPEDRWNYNPLTRFEIFIKSPDCDTLIWLDVDMIITADISELWMVYGDDFYAAPKKYIPCFPDAGNGVSYSKEEFTFLSADNGNYMIPPITELPDKHSLIFSRPWREYRIEYVDPGFRDTQLTFNAGVMVIGKKHLNQTTWDGLIQTVNKNKDESGNQSTLNKYFSDTVKLIPLEYNLTAVHNDWFATNPDRIIRIMHFPGSGKPWLTEKWSDWADKYATSDAKHLFLNEWEKYKDMYWENKLV